MTLEDISHFKVGDEVIINFFGYRVGKKAIIIKIVKKGTNRYSVITTDPLNSKETCSWGMRSSLSVITDKRSMYSIF